MEELDRRSGCNPAFGSLALYLFAVIGVIVLKEYGRTGLTILGIGLVVFGIAQLVVFGHVQRRLGTKIGPHEDTDAWFGKTLRAKQVRSRVLTLAMMGTAYVGLGLLCLC